MRRIVVVLALAALCGACRARKPVQLSSNLAAENKVTVRPVTLYYESAGDMLLHPESRNVALPENPAGAMAVVVREFFKPPLNRTLARSFPGDTVVRGAFLLSDGTAFVDLGGPTVTQGWGTGSHEELLAIYGLVQTVMANFPETRRVRLLVNGEPADTLAGHINIGRSLGPAPWLVAGAAATPSGRPVGVPLER